LSVVTAPDEARQFDFWIGSWIVDDADGSPAGRNTIEPILDGLALRESWEGADGHRGTSLNAWDGARGVWHQTWVDDHGLVLQLDGRFRDGAMVLEGRRPKRDDPSVLVRHRIAWSPLDGDPDRLRQHWEASVDDGATWRTLFDGRYRRADQAVR
jgi:hypothetical protein